MKRNDGFTLIELLVGILCAAIITGAALSLLLMGAKTNRAVLDANSEQQTVRIITSMVETLVNEGSIGSVEILDSSNDNSDWTIFDSNSENPSPILYYSASAGAIRNRDGSNLMTGVIASSVTLSDPDDVITGCLLNLSIETENREYNTSAFCRVGTLVENTLQLDTDSVTISGVSSPATLGARFDLLKILCSQYGSTGEIKGTSSYFSEWYLYETTHHGYDMNPGWNENTPWCACFLSWAVSELNSIGNDRVLNSIPCFANVDAGWSDNAFAEKYTTDQNYDVMPGDFIFFSWDNNPSNLEHVGAVLATDETWIYTIEGNSSGKVALRRYSHIDPSIVGYAVLNWK